MNLQLTEDIRPSDTGRAMDMCRGEMPASLPLFRELEVFRVFFALLARLYGTISGTDSRESRPAKPVTDIFGTFPCLPAF